MKKDLHPKYFKDISVQCICWNEFKINAAVEWPLKLDSCPKCNQTYTGKLETKVIKGRMEKYLEKQKKIDAVQKAVKK